MALVINGQRIDDAVVESEFGSVKAYHESFGNVSCCERDPEFRAMVRDNVAARALLAQEAGRRIDPTPEAELEAAVEKLKEEYGGEGWFFARTGATPETMGLVRRDVDLDLRVRRLLQELGDEGGPPPEAELRRFYEEHLDAFKTAEEVRASHILKTGRGGGGAAAEGRTRPTRRCARSAGNCWPAATSTPWRSSTRRRRKTTSTSVSLSETSWPRNSRRWRFRWSWAKSARSLFRRSATT